MTERRGFAMEESGNAPPPPPPPQRRVSVISDCRSYPEEALGLPYYHPTVTTMKEVRDIFVKYLDTGGFYLLRKSFTKSSTLTVSVVFSHSIKHFTISQKETGPYFLQGKLFSSIQELVGYYGKQEVPNKEEISGIFLKHPVLDLKRHHFFASTSKRHMSVDDRMFEGRTLNNSWREKNESRTTSDRKEHSRPTNQSSSFKAAAIHRSECELGYEKFGARNGGTSTSHGTSSHGTSSHGTSSHGTSSHGTSSHGSPSHGTPSHGTSSHGLTSSHGTSSHGTSSHGTSSHSTSATSAQRSRPDDRPFSGYLHLDRILQSDDTDPEPSTNRPLHQYADTGEEGRRRRSGLEPAALPRDRTLTNQQPTSPSSQSRSNRDLPHPQHQHDEGHRPVGPRSPILTPQPPPPANAPHLRYCYARSPYTQLAPSLVERLREIEGENAVKCECGIYHDDAELPRGWSFHRSTEPETYGRVLFTGPEGQLDWNLPLEVSLDLSADQQDKIRDLICRSPNVASRPCSHLLNAAGGGGGGGGGAGGGGSGSVSASNSIIGSGYQTLS